MSGLVEQIHIWVVQSFIENNSLTLLEYFEMIFSLKES